MIIVIPRISSQQEIYGIYAVCLSLTIFFTYADIGFLGAGQKYAAEYYGRNDLQEEIRVFAFVIFLLFLMISLFFILFLALSLNPALIIRSLTPANRIVASRLLLILACSSPVILMQRFCQSVFSIRIEDYIYQKIDLVFSVLKIVSVFYFFRPGTYDIVGYFFFFQGMSFCSVLFSIYIIRKKYRYDFRLFLNSFRFSADIYRKTKDLAFGSFVGTVSWILYYELDSVIISKFYGPDAVAIYAIGFTLLSFTRMLYGTIYAPFLARFNHFIGQNNIAALTDHYDTIIRMTIPICIFPALAMILLMKPLIIAWVGMNYLTSVIIAQLLISSVFWNFITFPGNFLIIAREKISLLYVNAIIAPVIFYAGLFLLKNSMGIVAFSLSKCFVFGFNGIFMIYVSLKILNGSLWIFLKEYILPVIIPGVVFLAIYFLLKPVWNNYLPADKLSLVKIIAVGVFITGVSIVVYYVSNKFSRNALKEYLGYFRQKSYSG